VEPAGLAVEPQAPCGRLDQRVGHGPFLPAASLQGHAGTHAEPAEHPRWSGSSPSSIAVCAAESVVNQAHPMSAM
jgi:hypothetical protein